MWEIDWMIFNRFKLPLMHSVNESKGIPKVFVYIPIVKRFVVWYYYNHVMHKAMQPSFLTKGRLHSILKLRKCVDRIETYIVMPYDSETCVDIIMRVSGWKSSIVQSITNSFLHQVLTMMQQPSTIINNNNTSD